MVILTATTNVGIGTTAPQKRLEVVDGTTGNSGLRLTSLTGAASVPTPVNGVLSVDPANGDVILVPGGEEKTLALEARVTELENKLNTFLAQAK